MAPWLARPSVSSGNKTNYDTYLRYHGCIGDYIENFDPLGPRADADGGISSSDANETMGMTMVNAEGGENWYAQEVCLMETCYLSSFGYR